MAIEVSQADVDQAEVFLVSYLSEKVPEADFSQGSAVRDLCVSAMSYMFAFLRKEIQTVRSHQSLANLRLLPDSGDRDAAVDEILSDLFITRKNGYASTVTATIGFSASNYYVIPAAAVFSRPDGVQFTLASGADLYLDPTDLTPVTVNDQTAYEVEVNLVCTTAGSAGNVPAGEITAVAPQFSTSILYIRTATNALGGKNAETTDELLARAPLALSTRNLVNGKSIASALMERFPWVRWARVIGAGDPEMGRDEVLFQNGTVALRTGGMVDVYGYLPRAIRTVRLATNALYQRPDNSSVILRDETVDFVAAGVVPGDVVFVRGGFTAPGPTKYVLIGVQTHQLVVQTRTPFPQATDETGELLTYSVGRLSPEFSDLVTVRTSGDTSRKTASSGRIVLPAGAVYDIRAVQANGVNYVRSNTPGAGKYVVTSENATYAQSTKGVVTLELPGLSDGTTVTVTYETVDGLNTLQAMFDDPAERTLTTHTLAKAAHPVYLSFTIDYVVRRGEEPPDPATIKAFVTDFVDSADGVLTTSRIANAVMAQFPVIWDITPLVIDYRLLAPDGQVFSYVTSRSVVLGPDEASRATFIGASALRSVTVRGETRDLRTLLADCGSADQALRLEANAQLVAYLQYLGVTDRTVRYLTSPDDVRVTHTVS